jgi:type VI secretion system protein ImpK
MAGDPSTPPAAGSGLADLSGGILRLALYLAKEAATLDAATLAARFTDLFKEFEANAQHANQPLASIQAAKYALVAFVDQQVLTSELPVKDAWLEKPLQMTYFDDFNAGEEFYVKLENLRSGNDPGRFAVLEVYHLCLALGFTGKLGDKRGEEQRRILIDRLAREIADSRPGTAGALSPSGLAAATAGAAATPWWLRLPAWCAPAAVLCLLLLLWLLYAALLGGAADGVPTTTLTRTVP